MAASARSIIEHATYSKQALAAEIDTCLDMCSSSSSTGAPSEHGTSVHGESTPRAVVEGDRRSTSVRAVSVCVDVPDGAVEELDLFADSDDEENPTSPSKSARRRMRRRRQRDALKAAAAAAAAAGVRTGRCEDASDSQSRSIVTLDALGFELAPCGASRGETSHAKLASSSPTSKTASVAAISGAGRVASAPCSVKSSGPSGIMSTSPLKDPRANAALVASEASTRTPSRAGSPPASASNEDHRPPNGIALSTSPQSSSRSQSGGHGVDEASARSPPGVGMTYMGSVELWALNLAPKQSTHQQQNFAACAQQPPLITGTAPPSNATRIASVLTSTPAAASSCNTAADPSLLRLLFGSAGAPSIAQLQAATPDTYED